MVAFCFMIKYHKNLYKIVDIIFIYVNICTYQQTKGIKTMRLTYDIKITEVTGDFSKKKLPISYKTKLKTKQPISTL